jgi:hypothetical protein
MKAAKETGILDYDKSATMNVKCKRDPQVVRAFLGLTDDNLVLKQADKLMKSSAVMDRLDPGDFEDYITAVDTYVQAVGAVDGLAYEARTDYASTEVFTKGDTSLEGVGNKKNYLEQSRLSVIVARDALEQVVNYLHL